MTDLDLWILLAVAVACWLGKVRERRQEHEDAAARRSRNELARMSFDNIQGQP